MVLKIALGADHRGFAFKQLLITRYKHAPYSIEWLDCGAHSIERSDYPVFAQEATKKILAGHADRAILLCGTGTGMAIAANRYKKIYAAVAWNAEIARKGREDDYVNVLCLPADYCTYDELVIIIDAWLSAEPKAGRYAQRLEMLD